MTVTEARDDRIARTADALRNAADRIVKALDNAGLMSTWALALREAVCDYDDAMSDHNQEEQDVVAADIYSQLMADRVTGYEESQSAARAPARARAATAVIPARSAMAKAFVPNSRGRQPC